MTEVIKTVFENYDSDKDGGGENHNDKEGIDEGFIDWSVLEDDAWGAWGDDVPEEFLAAQQQSEDVQKQDVSAEEAGWGGEQALEAEEDERKERARLEQEREDYLQRMKSITERYGIRHRERTPEAEEEAFRLYLELGGNKHNAIEWLMQADEEEIRMASEGIERIEGTVKSLPEEIRSDRKLDNIKVEFVRQYDSEVMTSEAVDDICDCIVDAADGGDMAYRRFGKIADGIQVAVVGREPESIKDFYDFSKELIGAPEDVIPESKYQKKSDLVSRYAVHHGLSKKNIEGFKRNVFPMVDARDPEVESLMEAINSFGVVPGEFGISDYTIHALVSEVSPRNSRDLMQIYREIPTSDYQRFEMNRKDASALIGTLWEGRDFIHDERPGIHELLEAMVKFYDTKDDADAHAEAEKRLRAIAEDRREPKKAYTGFDGELCFDIDNYDKTLSGLMRSGARKETSYDGVTAIEVLRRLEENTRQESLEKPKTGDEELDGLIERLEVIEKDNGEVVVDFDEVVAVVKRANEILIGRQGEIGLKPSMVKALSYTERMATAAMRGISGKDYHELPFDPGFKEIVRFNELTASGKDYSEEDFEHFWNSFVSGFSKTWEDNPSEGYVALSRRVTMRLHELARQYKAEGRPRYMTDSLWSGNLSHELIGLVDAR